RRRQAADEAGRRPRSPRLLHAQAEGHVRREDGVRHESVRVAARGRRAGDWRAAGALRSRSPDRSVATTKSKRKLTPAPAPPATFGNYLCYAVRALDRRARHYPAVNVDDQFWTTRTGIVVLRAAELCTPARTTAGSLTPSPVPDPRDQLVCYAITARG